MKFAQFDPRPTAEAHAHNDDIFASGPVIGVEVTVPALAARCVENIDPQHEGGDSSQSAIMEALQRGALRDKDVTLATVRPDPDALGAMALLAGLHSLPRGDERLMTRVEYIHRHDTFASGPWAPRDLPYDGDCANLDFAALGAMCADRSVPLTVRVQAMADWLDGGAIDAPYYERVKSEYEAMCAALRDGSTTVEVHGGVAVVRSEARWGTQLGYCLAPIVVCEAQQFSLGGEPPYHKFTICQHSQGYCDLRAVFAELSALEPGWGGSPIIGGSPQGTASVLTLDQVVEIVQRHLA